MHQQQAAAEQSELLSQRQHALVMVNHQQQEMQEFQTAQSEMMEQVQQYTMLQQANQQHEMAMAQQHVTEQNEEILRLRSMLLAQSQQPVTIPLPVTMPLPPHLEPMAPPLTGTLDGVDRPLPVEDDIEDDAIGQEWELTPSRTRRVGRWNNQQQLEMRDR